jgi:hypothetical protein
MWLVSTAGMPHASEASDLMPVYRSHGLASMASPRSLLMLEWSAPRGCDIDNPSNWRLASPHWTEERAEMVAEKRAKATTPQAVAAFGCQWLNIWPQVLTQTAATWLPPELVAGCGRPDVMVSAVAGAVEAAINETSWSACVTDGHTVATLPAASSLGEALAWLRVRNPATVLAHQAVANRLPADVPWVTHAVRANEDAAGTSLLAERVASGAVVWDNPEQVADQFGHVVVGASEGLSRIQASKSRGPVPVVKAMSWALWWCSAQVNEQPEVF